MTTVAFQAKRAIKVVTPVESPYSLHQTVINQVIGVPQIPRDQLIIVQTGMQPTAARHQSYYTMAVDQQDTLHMTWAEWGVVSARRRYFRDSSRPVY